MEPYGRSNVEDTNANLRTKQNPVCSRNLLSQASWIIEETNWNSDKRDDQKHIRSNEVITNEVLESNYKSDSAWNKSVNI